eukprot:1305950-Rhodomonas_salina.1
MTPICPHLTELSEAALRNAHVLKRPILLPCYEYKWTLPFYAPPKIWLCTDHPYATTSSDVSRLCDITGQRIVFDNVRDMAICVEVGARYAESGTDIMIAYCAYPYVRTKRCVVLSVLFGTMLCYAVSCADLGCAGTRRWRWIRTSSCAMSKTSWSTPTAQGTLHDSIDIIGYHDRSIIAHDHMRAAHSSVPDTELLGAAARVVVYIRIVHPIARRSAGELPNRLSPMAALPDARSDFVYGCCCLLRALCGPESVCVVVPQSFHAMHGTCVRGRCRVWYYKSKHECAMLRTTLLQTAYALAVPLPDAHAVPLSCNPSTHTRSTHMCARSSSFSEASLTSRYLFVPSLPINLVFVSASLGLLLSWRLKQIVRMRRVDAVERDDTETTARISVGNDDEDVINKDDDDHDRDRDRQER